MGMAWSITAPSRRFSSPGIQFGFRRTIYLTINPSRFRFGGRPNTYVYHFSLRRLCVFEQGGYMTLSSRAWSMGRRKISVAQLWLSVPFFGSFGLVKLRFHDSENPFIDNVWVMRRIGFVCLMTYTYGQSPCSGCRSDVTSKIQHIPGALFLRSAVTHTFESAEITDVDFASYANGSCCGMGSNHRGGALSVLLQAPPTWHWSSRRPM